MGRLDGKIALITGGSYGIGLATAQRFIAEGAEHVFITERRQQALEESIKTLNSKRVSAIQVDASKLIDLDSLYNIIKKEKGRLDILFANAAIGEVAALDSVTEKQFDNIFDINLKGVLFTAQKALPIFTDGGINHFRQSVHSASKAAIRSFARCWTVDLKEHHIHVNTLSPGPIDTSMLRSIPNYDSFEANIKAATAMNRIGTPDEIAKVAVFLASDDSSYITGIELFAEGGLAQI